MYKLVGADGKEYGPVGADQIREWVGQGRVNGSTLVSYAGGPLKPLSSYPELAMFLGARPPIVQAPPVLTHVTVDSRPSNNAAVAGLVCSVLGLVCCPVVMSIPGVLFSIVGLREINKNPQAYKTDRIVAILGIALGLVGLLIGIVGIMGGLGHQFRYNRHFRFHL
jgi:hypothetical protein